MRTYITWCIFCRIRRDRAQTVKGMPVKCPPQQKRPPDRHCIQACKVLLVDATQALAHWSRKWWWVTYTVWPYHHCRLFLHHWTLECAFIFVMGDSCTLTSLWYASPCNCERTVLADNVWSRPALTCSVTRRSVTLPFLQTYYTKAQASRSSRVGWFNQC